MRLFQRSVEALSFRPTDDKGSVPLVTPESDEDIRRVPSDRDFVAMRAGYRATGGIARGDDLARLLEDLQRGDVATLARVIASGDVFGFDWHGSFWVPMFQFELRDLSLKPAARQVQGELASVFDGWTMAVWFAQRNSWLDERKPVDLLDTEFQAVLQAARADRFIATG
ncbi:MAG: hypothetical protein H7Y33_06965 [Cytophagales bacterium]|nr:hypothetical protein [Rhizobacter sp.]